GSGRTGRGGLPQANRLDRRGMSCRPISSTYLNPAVVNSAVGAPLFSRIRLVATVVPCSARSTASPASPAWSNPAAIPALNPRDGSAGVDAVLAVGVRPPSGVGQIPSGNGPPGTTPVNAPG